MIQDNASYHKDASGFLNHLVHHPAQLGVYCGSMKSQSRDVWSFDGRGPARTTWGWFKANRQWLEAHQYWTLVR